MSRRRNELAPTLFPFLAVLVCTLGTLILFLALVAQNATEAAQQDVAESVPAGDEDDRPVATGMTAEQAERLVAEGKFRVEQLVSYRVEQTAEIEEQRDRLTHLDEHLDRLRQKLRRLREEVEAATSTSQEPAASRDEILLLKRQIESETEELRRLEAERENREPRIVIVPHDGPNGTDRRPVYLECADDALTIWPEGTRISFDQLLASTPAANPLDDALRIIRHHAMQRYGDASPPYPLLIVRPDGIDTYAAARRAMTDWDDQFGYELVPAATELAFPEPDLALRDRIERAVAEAVRGQRALQALIAGNDGGGQRGFGIGNGRSGNGSGEQDLALQPRPRRPLPSLSAAKLDQLARAKGYRSAGSFDAASVSDPFGRPRSGYRSPPAMPESLTDGAGESRRGDESGSELPYADMPLTAASGTQAGGGREGEDRAGQRDASDARHADQGMTREGSEPEDEIESESGGESETEIEPESGGEAGLEGAAGRGTNDHTAEGSGDGGSGAGGPSNPAPAAASPGGGTSSISGSGTPPPEMAEADQERIPQPTSSAPAKSRSRPRSDLVQRRGNRWGLPDQMSGVRGTAVVRGVRVVCYPDRYVLLPASGGGAIETFGLTDGDPQLATLELATAIRDRVARWGAPLPGGRWQPRLDVEVAAGAESRAQWLRDFMTGSGIDVRPVPHRPVPHRPVPDTGSPRR